MMLSDNYSPPTQEQIDAIDKKLVFLGYKYDKMVRAVVKPDMSQYILYDTRMTHKITFMIYISSVEHLSIPRLVRIKRESFYLLSDGEEVQVHDTTVS
jgi:hypothetical protein